MCDVDHVTGLLGRSEWYLQHVCCVILVQLGRKNKVSPTWGALKKIVCSPHVCKFVLLRKCT